MTATSPTATSPAPAESVATNSTDRGRARRRAPGSAVRETAVRETATSWLYLAPMLLAFGVWVYGPLAFTGALSVLDWDLISPDRTFVGADNYRRLVEEPEFGSALFQTGLYVLAMLPFATVVPMILAIMLWKRPGRASDVYRYLLFLPAVLAPVATALSWRFVLDPLGGVVNTVLGAVGLPEKYWLGDPDTALPTIAVITAAKFVALNMLLYGAALTALDRRVVDAARIDGATEAEITRHLVVPQLKGTTALLAGLCVVFAGQWVFTNIAILTQGGPDGSTDNVYHQLFTYAFTYFDAGTGAAAAITIVVLLTAVFGVSSLVRRRRGDER